MSRRVRIGERSAMVGAAAAATLGLTHCDKPPDAVGTQTPASSAAVPADTVTSSAGTAAAASAPMATEPAAQPGPPSEADAAAADDKPQPPGPAAGPDCKGKDRFTEACGYASPTRYAALDPRGIVNA